MANTTYKYEELHIRMTQEDKKQLRKVAMHHKMNENQLIKALIKREAIRIS